MNYTYVSQSRAGLKREKNEDALGIFEVENGLLAIVCDGLGGNTAGEVASNTLIIRFLRANNFYAETWGISA